MAQEFDTEIIRKKDEIRGSLFRANGLAVFLVAVLVLLGIGAVVQAFRAEQAEAAATEKLWESYLAQARALRFSGQPGRKQQILDVVKAAAKIHPSPELRDEAIAALAMKDLIVDGEFRESPAYDAAFDHEFRRYLLVHPSGSFAVRDWKTHTNIFNGQLRNGIARHYLSPKGNYLVLGDYDHQCHVWDLSARTEILTFRAEHGGWADITADEHLLAVGTSSSEIAIFDLDDASEVDRLRITDGLSKPRFAPDGRTLAIGGERIVQVLRYQNNKLKLLRRFEHPGITTSIAWSADGRHLAVGSLDWNIYLWDVSSGAGSVLKGHTREIVSAEFSPVDSVLMSYAWDGTTRFWNPLTGDLLFITHQAWGKQWSCDGKQIAFFKHNNGVGKWGFEYSNCLAIRAVPLGTPADVRVLAFAPNGKYFVAGNASRMLVHRTEGAELLAEISEREFKSASFLPDGSLLASSVDRLRTWRFEEAPPDELRLELLNETRSATKERPERAVVSKNGTWTAVDCVQNEVALFKGLDFSSVQTAIRHYGSGSLDFSPDEQKLVVGSWGGEGVAVYEVPSGKRLNHLLDRDAEVRFSHDGKWISTGATDAYRFYDGRSFSNVWTLTRDSGAQTAPVSAWSSEAGRVAVTLTGLSQEIVDVSRKEVEARLIPPFQKVVSNMRFSPDGNHLAVTTYERTIYLWDLRKLDQELQQIGLRLFDEHPKSPVPVRPRLLVYPLLFIGAMVGALLLAWVALKKHRGLLLEYSEAEMAAMRRSRELEVARAELAHSQKMRALGTLAAGIAHDFNNLLSIIRMANKLTAREVPDNPDVKENTQVIEEAVRQGKGVVKSMLGYSRENENSVREVSIPELVEDLVPLLSKQFLSGITLKLELDYTVPRVRTVPQRLEQILLNLIVNASEALQGQGRLTIETKAVANLPEELLVRPPSGQEFVRVSVRDNGPGVPPEIVDRIFEPFFTTKNSGSTRGTGLGLSIVHTIAVEEGYGIQLENSPGNGAAFHIFVPLQPVEQNRVPQREVVSSG